MNFLQQQQQKKREEMTSYLFSMLSERKIIKKVFIKTDQQAYFYIMINY